MSPRGRWPHLGFSSKSEILKALAELVAEWQAYTGVVGLRRQEDGRKCHQGRGTKSDSHGLSWTGHVLKCSGKGTCKKLGGDSITKTLAAQPEGPSSNPQCPRGV